MRITWLLTLIFLTAMIAVAVSPIGTGSPPEVFAQTDSAPDLTVPSVITLSDPFGYNPSFTLSVNVANEGNDSSGSTTLRYYRSADSTITTGDAEVGTDAVDGLAASERSSESIDLIAPSAPGTYYYGACVDAVSNESDTTNNCSLGIAWVVPAETSTDATLKSLTLSGIDFGTFASGTTSYSAQVANSVSQTTVTPTVNDSGASYVIKLGGATDADGVVALSVGSNVITVVVTAEDDSTTTYTVTVTRAAPPSTDATLSALTLSDVDFGTFASGTTSYSAQVANSVSQTTVTPTVNDSGASYVIKLGGATDADGVVALSVGSNVITVVVTAEDDSTTTYTVTVTRAAPPSTDATLSALTLSDVDFGTFASGTTSYSAQVANSVSQTTVTPTVNDSGASYVIKLGGATDADGVVALSVGSNVITVVVTAEDDSTTKTYSVTVTRATASISAPDLAVPSVITLSDPFGYNPSFTLGVTVENRGSGSSGSTTLRYYRSADSTITTGDAEVGTDAVDGLAASERSSESIDLIAPSAPGTYYYGACVDAVSDESDATNNCSGSIAFTVPAETSTDATLKSLTLSGIDFGTFSSGTTSYSAQVANSVTQTTVTPTLNDSGASYVIKLGGVTDADGMVALSVGSNVITVVVTAEDDSTTETYSVTVTRLVSLPQTSTDATLSALSLSRVNFGAFASATTSYRANVANSVSLTTVTPTLNDSDASYVIKLGGVTDADGVIPLSVGSNVITVVVTAEDDSTKKTYSVTVTRAATSISAPDLAVPSLSILSDPFGYNPSFTLSVNVVNRGSGSSGSTTLRYYRSADSTITDGDTDVGTDAVGGLAASGISIESIDLTAPSAPGTYYYGGCVDAVPDESDTTNNCSPGIAWVVPGVTSTDATLSGLSLSDVYFGTFSSGTTTYSAQVANSVTETTVTPTVNDSGASYVIKLGGVTDSDGTVSLAVGSNVITVVVTAEDTTTTTTYTVTVTRAEPPSTDATLKGLTLSEVDFGTFDSTTTSYSAQVANSVSQTTVTPVVNDSGASRIIKIGGVTDSDGTVPLAVGSNVITVEVTAEDDSTTQTYTVRVTRAEPPSTDATLKGLTLSDVTFGTFSSATTSYTAQVANSVTQTTVVPHCERLGRELRHQDRRRHRRRRHSFTVRGE